MVKWDWVEPGYLSQWDFPFQIPLDKYELPESKIILGLGCAMLSYISKLCIKEKLDVVKEILLMLLKSKRKIENVV